MANFSGFGLVVGLGAADLVGGDFADDLGAGRSRSLEGRGGRCSCRGSGRASDRVSSRRDCPLRGCSERADSERGDSGRSRESGSRRRGASRSLREVLPSLRAGRGLDSGGRGDSERLGSGRGARDGVEAGTSSSSSSPKLTYERGGFVDFGRSGVSGWPKRSVGGAERVSDRGRGRSPRGRWGRSPRCWSRP